MNPRQTTAVFVLLGVLLSAFSAGAQTSRPAAATRPTADANAPWGAESKGIALRLLARPTFCQGESVDLYLEVRNVSGRRLYLGEVFSPMYTTVFTMTVKGPDGKALSHGTYGGYTFAADAFKPIEPNEVWRMCFADSTDLFTAFDARNRLYVPAFGGGKYTAECAYMGVPLPEGGKGVTDEMKAGNWMGKAVSNEVSFTIHKPSKEDLRVHEWGVFTVHADVSHANASRKAEWASLPEAFYRQFPTHKLRFMPMIVEKPILYFYSARQAMHLHAKVRFAEGAPVVWWPGAEYPFDGGTGRLEHDRQRHEANAGAAFDYLSWRGWIGRSIPQADHYAHRPPAEPSYEKVTESKMPEDCWVAQARIDGPLPITVPGSQRGGKGTANRPHISETERFLFYDGLVKAGDWLKFIEREANAVTIQNAGNLDLGNLFIVDRPSTGAGEKAETVGFAHVATLKAGAKERIALSRLAAKDFAAAAPADVRKALLAAGLYEAEADSLLRIWQPGFFERGGVTAIVVLPQSEYDRMLPLEIDPPPGEIVRVGVALYPAMEASLDVAKQAAELLGKLDSDDFKAREAATKGLLEMGPAIIPHVEAALRAAKSAEVQSRCRDILEALDAREWLKDKRK